jgi:hypothetical protein
MAASNVTLHVAEIDMHNETITLAQEDGPVLPIVR